MAAQQSADSKVVFRTVHEDGSVHVETPWATALGNDQYQIDNSLWYAYGVSWQDIVYAPMDEGEGRAVFHHLVSKSGHRTVRIMFEDAVSPGTASHETLQKLVAVGCSYEGAWGTLFSVDIPPGVGMDDVRSLLMAEDVQWEHADPDYDTLFPGS
jgi:hypothetical protein